MRFFTFLFCGFISLSIYAKHSDIERFTVYSNVHGVSISTIGKHKVNSFWIEGEDGVIVIDTQWLLSDADIVLNHIADTVSQPITDILITHPHTDHFGGIQAFIDASPRKPIVHAGFDTARSIQHDEQGFLSSRKKQFTDNITSAVTIDHVLDDDQSFQIQGIEFNTITFRGNEAVATTLFYIASHDALFTGDMVNNDTMPIFYQGNIDGWIEQLEALKDRFPAETILFPGHGKPGRANELISRQLDVLKTYRNSIAASLFEHGTVNVTAMAQDIIARHPEYRQTAGIASVNAVVEQNILWILEDWRVKTSSASDLEGF
ncbi:MBL fold metallo-hydrolase [Alteromonas sp. P256]|uniref:MBL fold metallo-hydrolase n=1 Tax=Alteromonas sp. P256 TaxID=3117399 RepID=UPI002FE0856B